MFRWDHQTRVFTVDAAPYSAYRIVADCPIHVSQLELLQL